MSISLHSILAKTPPCITRFGQPGSFRPSRLAIGEKVSFGTNVAPAVMAPFHQHLFALRMDPAVTGHKNSLVVEEPHPLPIADPEVHNPFRIGYRTQTATVETGSGLDLDHTVNRVFKIVNENVINPVTGVPIGYKLFPCYS